MNTTERIDILATATRAPTARRFLRLKQVKDKTSFSTGHIYNLIKKGEFPKQVTIGDNRVAWLEHEVDAWIDEQVAKSRERAGVAA